MRRLVASKEFHRSGFSGADPRVAGWKVVLNSVLGLDNLPGAAPPQAGVVGRQSSAVVVDLLMTYLQDLARDIFYPYTVHKRDRIVSQLFHSFYLFIWVFLIPWFSLVLMETVNLQIYNIDSL